ncbi:MAG TPA: methyltransferase domain-containing protein [Flavisolibacter sp.]|nr:methyltransferase domain-containing protein [Flavisolibacter sp.]
MKDLFSNQSGIYAMYRPGYPPELYDYILQFVNDRLHAWDCATGNGQCAAVLAGHFEKVSASDISAAQLTNAVQKPNISYLLCPAEQTPFPDNSFDLITIATAYHWFDAKAFFKEANRVGKPGAVVAAWAYQLLCSDDEQINKIILRFYQDIVGPYWDPERKHIDESYANIDFAFEALPSSHFTLRQCWTRDHFKGFLQTWSAFQHYLRQNGTSPLLQVEAEIDAAWKDGETKIIEFPLFLKIGRVSKTA